MRQELREVKEKNNTKLKALKTVKIMGHVRVLTEDSKAGVIYEVQISTK